MQGDNHAASVSDVPAAPAPAELVAETIGFWDAQIRTVVGLAKEVGYEFTSKERLRNIAKVVIMQLVMLLEAAKAEEEAQAAQTPEQSTILVPDKRIVLP